MKHFSFLTFLILVSCSDKSKDAVVEPQPSDAASAEDHTFERLPYIASIETVAAVPRTLSLIGVHLKPAAAVTVANMLDDVSAYVAEESMISDALILGDMNLSCAYASDTALRALDMRRDSTFHWLIPDTADTTVADSSCAYDRIISVGEGLGDLAEGEADTRAIVHSDHRPVWVSVGGIRMGAFNTKVFGATKAENAEALTEIALVVCSGDLILLQELVTADLGPVDTLLARVRQECGDSIQMSLSEPTGSTSYKERFAYFYRPEKVSFKEAYLMPATWVSTSGPITSQTETTVEQTTAPTPSAECGLNPYKTSGGYCYATKDGTKKRVAGSCCP